MSVAYVTYMDLATPIGGAQSMDRDMISRAPTEVSVLHRVPERGEYDHIIVTAAAHLADRNKLGGQDFIYWPHDAQENDPAVFSKASTVVWTTPAHRRWGEQFTTKARHVLNPSWFDTSMFNPGTKTADVLWAHRDVRHKGRNEAEKWAQRTGAKVTYLTGVPREQIAEAMAIHRRFILLSDGVFDIAPLTVMEAQLSGCELIVNDQVGWWDEPADVLRARIDRAGTEFWNLV